MSKIEEVNFQSWNEVFEKLDNFACDELNRRIAYDDKYPKDTPLQPFLLLEHCPSTKELKSKQDIGQEVAEQKIPSIFVFVGKEEIEKGKAKLKELEQDEKIEIEKAIMYIPKNVQEG